MSDQTPRSSPGTKESKSASRAHPAAWFFLCLFGVLAVLFFQSFHPDKVHFANDNPLGIYTASWVQPPECFTGVWTDLGSLGGDAGVWAVTLSNLLRWALGPVGYSKFDVPFTLLFLGGCVWVFLRVLKFSPRVSAVGALAAALSSNFVSASCWGVGTQVIGIGYQFLALAAIISSESSHRWIKLALAGMAVGLAIVEGLDNGALFSLFIAALVVYRAVVLGEGPVVKRFVRGVASTAVVAISAFLIASQMILSLIGTQIQGVVGNTQDDLTKQQRWDWATQWSFPKRETLSLVIPGLFGYRMDTPANLPDSLQDNYRGGNYWGAMGRDPNWDRYFAGGQKGDPPQGFMRYSGGGGYLGVAVSVIALWAALQAFRRNNSVFSLNERRFVWFWVGVATVALLLAFGRFAPFYQLFYSLPYFSTIRNPVKFLAIFSWAVLVLFAFGLHGLNRRYLEGATSTASGRTDRVGEWWRKERGFDKRWMVGCLAAIVVSVFGWLIYYSSRLSLQRYLEIVQFEGPAAQLIAQFSIRQVGWFVLFLSVTVGLLLLIMSGVFAGKRARWAAILLGLVVVTDLARANLPWIIYWDYKEKYASNPIIDLLRDKPYEHRVVILPFRTPPEYALFDQVYRIEWLQQHFPYFDIQSLDFSQMPRVPQDLAAFEGALQFRGTEDSTYLIARRWALTNTRYLLGAAPYLEVLNGQVDPQLRRFRIIQAFNIVPKPGIPNPTRLEDLTAEPSPTGKFALFEFTGALPRAKLYSRWQVSTNDEATLKELSSPSFDPWQTVLVATPVPGSNDVADAGTVEYISYQPKEIRLRAEAKAPCILLLNDKYDSDWKVFVDGKPTELLRCNFFMRGIHLPPGSHEVALSFKPSIGTFYVSMTAIVIGFGLLGFVLFSGKSPGPARPRTGGPADENKSSRRAVEHPG